MLLAIQNQASASITTRRCSKRLGLKIQKLLLYSIHGLGLNLKIFVRDLKTTSMNQQLI